MIAVAGIGTFEPGRITAVVGGDGAGKSTLLRALTGSTGSAHDPFGAVSTLPKERIGYQSAASGTWLNLSVAENLQFIADSYSMPKAEAAARTAEFLVRAGLDTVTARTARNLSGGMRQKLGFIMAALHRPDLLLLDEPSTGVDPVSRGELWSLLSAAAAEGAAVVFSTTYLDEAERASRLYLLDAGSVLASGTPDEVIAHTPGHVWRAETGSDEPPGSWRRGRVAYCWTATDSRPVGFTAVTPDLETSAIAFMLERDSPAADPSEAAPSVTARSAASPRAAASLVKAIDVTKSFGSFTALEGVSLSVGAGEVVGLLGGNGAGKTTLMRILLGVESTSAGSAELFGDAPTLRARRRLGYVAQGFGLYPTLTAMENLQFAASVQGVSIPAPAVSFAGSAGRRPTVDLPLGTQRMLAYLAASCHDPELLILDEPTSGMDPLASVRLWGELRRRADSGVGVLVTTHNMQEAQQCDRLVMLSEGRVVAAGTLEQLTGSGASLLVEASDWEEAFASLTAAGLRCSLDGRALRVSGATRAEVEEALAGVRFALQQVPRTLEEMMGDQPRSA